MDAFRESSALRENTIARRKFVAWVSFYENTIFDSEILANHSAEAKAWSRNCGYVEHVVCVSAVLQSWDWQASTRPGFFELGIFSNEI